MPSPMSGNAGSAVSPISPKDAYEADKADPGEMAQIKAEEQQAQAGKYGDTAETPYKAPQSDEEKKQKQSWVEIKLVDADQNPVAGEPFKVTLPDGSVFTGTLDDKGVYRLEGIDPGTCQITFPNLDEKGWEKAGGGG